MRGGNYSWVETKQKYEVEGPVIGQEFLCNGRKVKLANSRWALIVWQALHTSVHFTLTNNNSQTSYKVKAKVKSLSRVWLFASPWTVAYQAPPSTGFSRQGYWSGLSFPSPGDLPDPGIEPRTPTLPGNSLPTWPPGKTLLQCQVLSITELCLLQKL